MTALTFSLRNPISHRINMQSFTPDNLKDKSLAEIQSTPVQLGLERYPAGEIFNISGHDTQQIRIQSDSSKLDEIGAMMSFGEIIVEGQSGAYAGRKIQGGSLRITGNTGIYAGADMSGGRLLIEGNADDFLGAASAGEKQGMTGGEIIVHGNSGARTGDRQRRGLIIIHGDSGDFCGSRMVAGTLAIAGQCGKLTGFNMKRGTLITTQEPQSIPVTFGDNGRRTLPFLNLLLQEIHRASSHFPNTSPTSKIHRLLGDSACGGMGEILLTAR